MSIELKKDDFYSYLGSLMLEKHGLSHEYCRNLNTVSYFDDIPLDDWNLVTSDVGNDFSYRCYLHSSKMAAAYINANDTKKHITYIKVYGTTDLIAEEFYKQLTVKIKPNTPEDPETTGVNFFYNTRTKGPQFQSTTLTTPKLEDTIKNYPASVQGEIMKLAITKPQLDKGRLILWHGPPGTGKTSAIRSLLREWRTWADYLYITDPDEYFNDPAYFYFTLVGQNHQSWAYSSDGANYESDRWKILVVEDSGEFLRQDAGIREKQAVSRLLNASDGLLGQGMRFLIMITTNEPVKELSEAVSRPGRCLANTEFELFSPDEASDWLGRRVSERKSLAELFQMQNNMQVTTTKERVPVGFGQYL